MLVWTKQLSTHTHTDAVGLLSGLHELKESQSVSRSVVSHSLQPHGLQPTRLPVHGILQARILEWVAMPSSRESSQSRDGTGSPELHVVGLL